MLELDETLKRLSGREAERQRLIYKLTLTLGELPFTDEGVPFSFFSFRNNSAEIKRFLEKTLESMGLAYDVTITPGRAYIADLKVALNITEEGINVVQ